MKSHPSLLKSHSLCVSLAQEATLQPVPLFRSIRVSAFWIRGNAVAALLTGLRLNVCAPRSQLSKPGQEINYELILQMSDTLNPDKAENGKQPAWGSWRT